MEKQTVSVRVPATVGNFSGAGDCGAMALDASLNVKITRRLDGHVGIRYFGENGERVPRDRWNLVVRAMETALQLQQREFTGADLEIYSSVPVAVGLGSSSAAVLAGLIGANLLYRLGLDEKTLLGLASVYESRRGNLCAAWLGGFAASVDMSGLGDGQPTRAPYVYHRTAVPESLVIQVVVPETSLVPGASAGASGLPSDAGRESRPSRRASDKTGKRDAEHASGKPGNQDAIVRLNRAATLAEYFAKQSKGKPVELDATLPPTCKKNVAGLEEALQVRTPGLLSIFVCGSGPAVAVFAAENSAAAVRAVREAFARNNVMTSCFEFRPTNSGALDWNGLPHDVTLPPARTLSESLHKSNSFPV